MSFKTIGEINSKLFSGGSKENKVTKKNKRERHNFSNHSEVRKCESGNLMTGRSKNRSHSKKYSDLKIYLKAIRDW